MTADRSARLSRRRSSEARHSEPFLAHRLRSARVGTTGLARSPLPWLGALLALYLLLPLAGFVYTLAHSSQRGFGAAGLGSAFVVSVVTATISTAICAVLGVPLAYCLAKSRGRLATAVGVAVLVPLALPPLMAGILLISVVGPNTAIGGFFGGRLTDTMAGIVLAQTFVAAPFTIVAARSAFSSIDPALLDVATTLGLGAWRRFSAVALPVAAWGIVAGLALTWLRAFGEFGATVILAYHPYSLPVFTYVRFGGFGLSQAIAPTTLAIAAGIGLLLLTHPRHYRRRRAAPAVTPASFPASQGARTIAFDLDRRLGTFRLQLAYRSAAAHLAILGPSGSGKTSTLRGLAGLDGINQGDVRLGEETLSGRPTETRRLGYVPQEPTLVPGRNVWQQVTLGRHSEAAAAAFWLQRLGLGGLETRFPQELSGGQRHRVALARALCQEPSLVLLDEPFAALDPPVRQELHRELRQLQRTADFSSVLVTHDAEEAAFLAEEIIIINDGTLLQGGPVSEVFAHPARPLVARLLGVPNICSGTAAGQGTIEVGRLTIRSESIAIRDPGVAGMPVLWSVRPERIVVSRPTDSLEPSPSTFRYTTNPILDASTLEGVVLDAVHLGSTVELRISVGGLELLARANPDLALSPGEPCAVGLRPQHVTAWMA